MLARHTPKVTRALVALLSDFPGRIAATASAVSRVTGPRYKKPSLGPGFLLRCGCRLRFAPAAQAETREAEAKQRERAGFGDPSNRGKRGYNIRVIAITGNGAAVADL